MDNDKYIGRLLDNRYEILEVIGTGGMAVVYKARCHRLNRLVAIKILKDDLSQDEEFRRRFHAESQAVAMLSHPNIMSVYDVSTTDEADYIVMELIDGITLKQYMEKKGVLNWKETLHFGMQIAKALEHAHSRGIVHRDIKPHNVMVLKNGSVKVTDFGIARIMSAGNTLTKEALGSVHYISPEQAKGGRVDARSDLYSLGVVMYEMMTGRPPYDGESPVAVAIQHINATPPMPSVLNPNIPGGLEQIIMKAMEKDPDKRYANATQMLYDMEEFRKNPGILFDFNASPIDDVTRITQPVPVPQEPVIPVQPRTTAERVAGVRTDRPAGNAPTGRIPSGGRPVQTGYPGQQPRPGQTGYPGQTSRPTQGGYPQSQRSRPAGSSGHPESSERRPSGRPASPTRQEREEMAESRNRTMSIAVITCSAIAIIGIVVFLIVMLNGGLFSREDTVFPVPDLVGKVFDEIDYAQYPNVKIVLRNYEYSDRYEVGQISRQEPQPQEKVAAGTEVTVWISKGPEESELPVMDNLSGDTTEQAAKDYLDALDLDLVPIIRQESSDDVKEGFVVRTEPAAGQPLNKGQTVTVYISSGPEVKKANVPNVIGMSATNAIKTLDASGFKLYKLEKEESIKDKDEVIRLSVDVNTEVDVSTEIILYISEGHIRESVPNVMGETETAALRILREAGFNNVRPVREENDAEKDTVFRQSIPANVEIDTTTEILIYVSDGPAETEPPTTVAPTEAPTEAPAEAAKVTKNVTVAMPSGKFLPYKVTVVLNGATVYEGTVQPGTESIVVTMTGSGVQSYDVLIDGEKIRTEKVDFSA